MHARSGLVGLNVVTAALDADPRTEGIDVRFVKDAPSMIEELAAARAEGKKALAFWSFYSPDFAVSAQELAVVKASGEEALHVVGGVHATAEPLATLQAGFDLVALGEGEHTSVARRFATRCLR
ncbi:cobalamin-dependent protein [Labilithrix luteola]|nr:cobalamin-dependent protein [Labilithrix luteola]